MSKTIEQLLSENKKLKQNLKDLQSQFAALSSFEKNAKEIFWQMDFSLKTTYISPAIEKFLGYTPQEYLQKDLSEVLTPESYKKALDLSKKLIKEGQVVDPANIPSFYLWEVEYVNKEGKTKSAKIKFSLFLDDKGNPKGIQGFTFYEELASLFLHEKNQLKEIWDKANIAIFIVQDGIVTFWNNAAFNLIKHKTIKSERLHLSDLIYKDDLPLVADRYQRRLKGEEVEPTYNFRVKTAQGDIRWIQLHSAFYIWDGKPATLNFARDITEEIALKQRLETTNYRFKILSQNSSNIIGIYQGINLVYLSENTKRILGYMPKLKTLFELINYIHPEDKERVKQQMEAIITEQKQHAILVYRIQHASGKYLWFEVSIDIKYKNGQIAENIAVAHDITQRKRLEKEIEDKERLYRFLAENTSDGIALYEYGKLIYQSPGREKMLGETPQIETLEDAFKYIHPQDLPGVQKIMEEVLQKKLKSLVTQYRIKHSSGYYLWVEVLVNIEYDKAGNPARVIFKTRDISSRVLLEEQTRKSEEQYRLLAENSTDGVALFENGELIYMSPSYKHILGDFLEITRIEEMFDYIHPEDLPAIKAQVKRIIDEKIKRDISTYRIRKSDGTYVWFEDIIHSEFDETGNQIRVILNSRDVTKRMETQRALVEKEKQIKLLLDNISDFIFLVDNDGIIKFTTPFTLDYFGFEEAEVLGKSSFEFVYPADLEKFVSEFTEAVNEKKMEQKSYRITHKNGKYSWVEFTGNFIENSDSEIILVGRDITERIEIQNQLKEQHKELEELNATKDKFFSILAHDLRSPFNQIIGFSNLLKRNIYQYDIEKIAHFVNIIREASVKTYQLLENLLNWSMAMRGVIEFFPVKINIVQIIKEEINQLTDTCKAKNIDLQFKNSETIFLTVDENMFRIIVRNLINNAIKYTPINGKIIVEINEKDSETIFSVSDNGVGMYDFQIYNLFKVSKNHSSEGTKGEKGTGLGMLIVKEFVDKHQAKIEIKSQKNKGTEIQVVFPEIML